MDNIITINDVTNILTCNDWKYYNKNKSFEYTIQEKDLNVLEMYFAKGIYEIVNF